jgi:hypothetical protein
MFAAHSANPHLAAAAAADPYNVSNTLHNFQTSQVRLQRFGAGLPDGFFKSTSFLVHFGSPLNGKLVYFVAICFILWQFGILHGHQLYYPNFGLLYQ